MNKAKRPEKRTVARQEFRVSSANGVTTIGGYAAVFDSPTVIGDSWGWNEEIDPAAFDSVMATTPDVRCLFNHEPDALLGRTASGTLRLSLDSRGLAYECDLPDTQLGRDIGVLMERRDITGSSFGFICKRDQWTDNNDGTITRRILEFEELLDVSPVTYPAYLATSATARSLPASIPSEFRSRLEGRSQDCTCDCVECMNGDCADCSDLNCTCAGCDCIQDEFNAAQSEMEMRVMLAEARAL